MVAVVRKVESGSERGETGPWNRHIKVTIMKRNVQNKSSAVAGPVDLKSITADELKGIVRDGMFAMTAPEREAFCEELQASLKKVGLDLVSYVIPLGITGRSAEDLTPTEIGHLLRYLRINVPKASSVILRVLSKFPVFSERHETAGKQLAA